MKKGFSLLLSIIFLMVMAFVGIMVMSFSASTSYHVRESYLDTKAELVLKSATEYAILALQGHHFQTNKRLKHIHIDYPLFNADIKFHYFLTNCPLNDNNCTQISTADTNGSVIVYVEITSKNLKYHIRKFRSTLQNP